MSDYRQSFKAEMFKHLREDFEDSFSPAGAISPKFKKPIMVPLTYFREKSRVVENTLLRKGLQKPSGFESMTLAKEIFDEGNNQEEFMENPSTPKIPDYMYDDFFAKFFGADSLRANPIKTVSPGKLLEQFKSSMQHMAGLFLRQKIKLSNEDYVEKKGMTGETESAEHKRIILNQYRRTAVSMIISSLMKRVYLISPSDIDEMIRQAGFEDRNIGDLKRKESHNGFAKGMTQIMDTILGNQDLGKAILAQIKKSPTQKKITQQS